MRLWISLALLTAAGCTDKSDSGAGVATGSGSGSGTGTGTGTGAATGTGTGAATGTGTGTGSATGSTAAPCGSPHVPTGLEVLAQGTKLYDHVDGCALVQVIDGSNLGKVTLVQFGAAGQTATDIAPSAPAYTDFGSASDDGSVMTWIDNDGFHVGRFDGTAWADTSSASAFSVALSGDGTTIAYFEDGSLRGADVDAATPPGLGSPLAWIGGTGSSVSVSANGQWAVFSTDLALDPSTDTNGLEDIWVTNAVGQLARISQTSVGADADGASRNPVISADGRFIAFESEATNLDNGDNNGMRDVFLHDRDLDGNGVFDEVALTATRLVSIDDSGSQPSNGSGFFAPSISADGNYIAFHGSGTGLDPAVTDPSELNVYVHEDLRQVTALVSSRGAAKVAIGDDASSARIAPSGETVVFGSASSFLGNGVFEQLWLAPNPVFLP